MTPRYAGAHLETVSLADGDMTKFALLDVQSLWRRGHRPSIVLRHGKLWKGIS